MESIEDEVSARPRTASSALAMSFNPEDEARRTQKDGGDSASDTPRSRLNKSAGAKGSQPDLGLLNVMTKYRDGATPEEVAHERETDRDDDQEIIEQDALLRTRQSLSSTLNDPTLDGDGEDWWDYLDSWIASDSVAPIAEAVVVPEVQVADFNHYMARMAPFRTFFAENALELLEQEKNGDNATDFLQTGDFDEEGNYVPVSAASDPVALREVLNTVPALFMKPPPTFYVEDANVIEAAFTDEGTQLLEDLTRYEQMVEEQLLVQIGSKFNSFFNLLEDFEVLESDMKEACECVTGMRQNLQCIEEPVRTGLQVSELMGQRRNLQELREKLELINHLRQSQATIRSLVASNDFSGATKLAAECTQVLQEDLAGCRALQHMLHKVNKMSTVVQNKMQADFVDTASQFSHEEVTRQNLLNLILGLQHSEQLVSALGRYRTALLAETKRTVEESISAALKGAKTDVEAPRTATTDALAEALCTLEHGDCMKLLQDTTSQQLRLVRRAVDMHAFLVEGMREAGTSPADGAFEAAEAESCSVLCDACDESHKKCARVLMARARLISQLSLQQFHEMFELMLGFCVDGEKLLDSAWEKTVQGRAKASPKSVSLRSTLLQQAKEFIKAFHEAKMAKLNAMLDQEMWSQADVPAQFQEIVDNFAQRTSAASAAPTERKMTSKMLLVQGQHYRVPMSLLQLLKELGEYMNCADHLPALSTDLLQRIIEILGHYNQRTCQLVLGAGAMHLAGLKSITARHLVLMSQCLSVMLVSIPLMRQYLAAYLPAKHEVLLIQLDSVAKNYLEHRSQIHSKIVNIFKERIDFHCRAVLQASNAEPTPRGWARNLLKESTTLYRVLIQYLPEDQLSPIFQQIAHLVNQHLVTHLSGLDLSSSAVQQALDKDLDHLLDGSKSTDPEKPSVHGLRGLQHFQSSFSGLEDFINQRLKGYLS